MPVAGINEILRYDVAAHLQSGEVSIETAAHFRSRETACRTQLARNQAAFAFQRCENSFLDASFFGVRINAAAVIAEVGPPLTTDECRLATEKLAVCKDVSNLYVS